jgi:BASS family bile acid:Na+ symporter
MTLAKLILLALQVSIFLTVFTIGLHAKFGEAMSLWRRPAALLKSLTAMFVVMPIFAVWLTKTFDLDRNVMLALLILSVSPVPPILPFKGAKVGAESGYVFGLLVETALLSVVITPVAIVLLGKAFGVETQVPALSIAVVVVKTVLLPLGLGVLVRALWPAIAERIARPLGRICMLILVAGGLLILIAARHAIGAVLAGDTVVAIAAFAIVGIVVGQVLGGPDREDSTFLAIATAARHPGVAIAVAHSVAPEQKLVIAAVLLYLLVNAVVGVPYTKWRKRGSPAAPAAGPLPQPSR